MRAPRRLEGEACLAGAARAGERHEPRRVEETRDLDELRVAPDETGERIGKRVGRIAHEPKRRGRGDRLPEDWWFHARC